MKLLSYLVPVILILLWTAPVQGDVFRPAYLEIKETSSNHYDVLWKIPALPDGRRLDAEIRFPADTRQAGKPQVIRTKKAWIERFEVEHPQSLAGQTVVIEGLRGAVTDVIVNMEWLNGVTQVIRVLPEDPEFEVQRAHGKGAIALSYLRLGVEHIITGVDHLLFVTALLLIVRGWQAILATITAFTFAHSLTLAAATFGWIRVPSSFAEALIALSIVFVAAEALRGTPTLSRRMPWLIACGFGLLHGIGFASALTEIGLAETAIPLALLMFNAGVELGQLAFVACILVAGFLLRMLTTVFARRLKTVVTYGIGATSSFWTIERIAAF